MSVANIQTISMTLLFPLVTVDIALFTLLDNQLRMLLVERANSPSKGQWALPGGVLRPDLDSHLEETARRILATKIQVHVPYLEQVTTVSGATRDPRGWSISTLFYALLPAAEVPAVAAAKTAQICWADPADRERALAFDHARLRDLALASLRDKVGRKTLPLHLLPAKFTLTEVQAACEAILGRPLDKGTFRRQIRDDAALVALPGECRTGPQRPAQLYSRAASFRFGAKHGDEG